MRDRARQRGKSDTLDAERIAREVLAHSSLPKAFKRAGDQAAGPDEPRELLMLYQRARRSVKTSRQHLLNEAEMLLAELPLELRDRLPDTRPCARAYVHSSASAWAAATTPRLAAAAAARGQPTADHAAGLRRTPRLPQLAPLVGQRQHARPALRPGHPLGSPSYWSRSATRAASRPGSANSERHSPDPGLDRRGPRRARPATAATPAATGASNAILPAA